MKRISPPALDRLDDYYRSYSKYIPEDDLLAALHMQSLSTVNWLNSLPERIENHRYQDGKWMLKEVIGHLCDTERILSYRALRFARNDNTTLPGFDENSFVRDSGFAARTLRDIVDEWKSIRSATISLFSSMSEEAADRSGIANGSPVSPRILLYFLLAHERHHIQIMKDRYLTTVGAV
jgi:hypothetical protein